MEAPWLTEARKHVRLREIKGPAHAAEILSFWREIRRSGIKDDETPWRAAFVGACLERAGIVTSRFESAASCLKWGVKLDHPEVGCIAVISRPLGLYAALALSAGLLACVFEPADKPDHAEVARPAFGRCSADGLPLAKRQNRTPSAMATPSR